MPVVYSVPGMDRVTVREDFVYRTVDIPQGKLELKLDAYVPPGAAPGQRFPAVILISGGAVENPDWRRVGVYTSYGRLLAASGLVAINYQKRYQRGPEGIITGDEDTRALVEYVRQHAAELNIDPDRLAVWGFSAGGRLLAYPLRERPPYVRAVVCFYGTMQVSAESFPENLRSRAPDYSPLDQVSKPGKPLPAIFVGRAGLDFDTANATIDRFVQAALAQNANIEVMNHPDGRHAFDILEADDRSREIIRRAIEFLKASLK